MSLYTPQTAMQSPTSRMIMAWYERFDVFVALMGGFEAALPAEWFSSPLDFWQKKAASEPENLSFKIEELAAKLRMISRDMALLFARNSRGTIGEEEFVMEHSWLSDRLDAWRAGWDPALRDSSHLVSDFTNKQPSGPFEPGVIHDFPLFPLTILESEWHSLMIMHKSQAPQSTDLQELQSEVADHAIAICQTFEAVEQWPMSPPGSLVALYAGLAVSALFLPRDAKHEMWLRRKFAKLETMG